jgi:SsrA-binding protein
MAKPKTEPLIVKNRRASFDYDIDERIEAGISLVGSEVKSMRAGKVDVTDAYIAIEGGQAWLKQMFVAPFEQASAFPHETRRSRRLLMHKREIEQVHERLSREGATAVPMRLYFKDGRVKVEIGIGRGKKRFDKRHDIAKKDADREATAAMREGGRR